MPRTSTDKVRAVLGLPASDDADYSVYIATANSVITGTCVGIGYPDEHLVIMETWLAAHFVALQKADLIEERIGEASEKYQYYKLDLGFNATKYGQQVLAMDYLRKLPGNEGIRRPKATLTWIGSYCDRGAGLYP